MVPVTVSIEPCAWLTCGQRKLRLSSTIHTYAAFGMYFVAFDLDLELTMIFTRRGSVYLAFRARHVQQPARDR